MWNHYTTLYDTTDHREWLWVLFVILHSGRHAVMKLPGQRYKPVRVAKLVHNFPQPITSDSIKGLDQVNEGGIEADILFLTLLLQLPYSKYHANSISSLSGSKSCSRFCVRQLSRILVVVITNLPAIFSSIERNNWSIFYFLQYFSLIPNGLEKLSQLTDEL